MMKKGEKITEREVEVKEVDLNDRSNFHFESETKPRGRDGMLK